MVGRKSQFTTEIRLYKYVTNRCLLGIGCKTIFNEICSIYEHNEVSFSSIIRCFYKFKGGLISNEDASHARGVNMSAKICAKVKTVVNTDIRYTARQMA